MQDLAVSIDFLEFPQEMICATESTSPKITLRGLESTSVAIMVFNPSMRDQLSYCSWLIWNLPPLEVIPAGIPRYLFRVYGLDDFIVLPGGARKQEFHGAMHAHILQYGETECVASR